MAYIIPGPLPIGGVPQGTVPTPSPYVIPGPLTPGEIAASAPGGQGLTFEGVKQNIRDQIAANDAQLAGSDTAVRDPNSTIGQRAYELAANAGKGTARILSDIGGGVSLGLVNAAQAASDPTGTIASLIGGAQDLYRNRNELAGAAVQKVKDVAGTTYNALADPRDTTIWKNPAGAAFNAYSVGMPVAEGFMTAARGAGRLGAAAGILPKTETFAGPVRAMELNAPKAADVHAAKQILYDRLDNAGVRYHSSDYDILANNIANDIGGRVDERLHPKTFGMLQYMTRSLGTNPTLQKVHDFFSELKAIDRMPTTGPGAAISERDKFMANRVQQHLNDFMDNAQPMTGTMSQADVRATTNAANDLARSDILHRDIEHMAGRAEGGYLSGEESAIRNQFKNYWKKNWQNLSPLERAAFANVANREGLKGLVTSLGGRLGGYLSAAIGAHFGDWPGAIAGAGVHLGARKLGGAVTDRLVDRASATVLAGTSARTQAEAALSRLSSNRRRALTAAALGALRSSGMGPQ